jgi:hypothetical protein
MKLILSQTDPALNLPLHNSKVYFTDDNRYKVLTSYPFKMLDDESQLITISGNPATDQKPPEGVCLRLLEILGINDAIDADKEIGFPHGAHGVRRFINAK